MTCLECLRPCELHGVRRCATCHEHEGECGYGGCEAPARVRFDDRGAEIRTFCLLHANSPRYAWLRVGMLRLDD